jgi:hypothetical protein
MTRSRRLTLRLRGGLGNQIFQYVAARSVVRQVDRRLEIDASESRLTHDRVGLTAFSLPDAVFRSSLILPAQLSGPNLRWLSLKDRIASARRLDIISTAEELEGPVFASASRSIVIDGYFQSPDLVEADLNRDHPIALSLKAPSSWYLSLAAEAQREQPVMVHLRRGDYRDSRDWGLLSHDYYRAALGRIEGPSNRPIWLFSDEVEAAASIVNYLSNSSVRVIRAPSESPAAESLLLMSSGSCLIMANSTLSWWAGRLTHGRVIAPKPFQPDGDLQSALSNPPPSMVRRWSCIPSYWEDRQ